MTQVTQQFKKHYPVLIIGGGQAGLSLSFCLKEKKIDHLILEKQRMAESWRSQRWDSFCLVTPNWQCQLPGYPYAGEDPHGFMKKEEIVDYLQGYVRLFNPPLQEGVAVNRLGRREGGGFELATTLGELSADQVVVATGGYHGPKIPRLAERFSPEIKHLHSSEYKNPAALPAGEVLVVGTGQSGCQIAEDLHLAGRRVHLCVGGAPRTARRYRGQDVVQWLHDMGYYDKPVHEHPLKDRVRAKANHYVTGRDGGRDIDLRKFAVQGMQLYGRLKGMTGQVLHFGDDLKKNLDQADAVAESIKSTIDQYIASAGIKAPDEERYRPVWEPKEGTSDLDYQSAKVSAVIWSVGYQTDYSWVEVPIFDGKGYPCHQRGVTPQAGLYFLGLPWQYTWGSGRFSGVGADAAFLSECIQTKCGASQERSFYTLNEWALGS